MHQIHELAGRDSRTCSSIALILARTVGNPKSSYRTGFSMSENFWNCIGSHLQLPRDIDKSAQKEDPWLGQWCVSSILWTLSYSASLPYSMWKHRQVDNKRASINNIFIPYCKIVTCEDDLEPPWHPLKDWKRIIHFWKVLVARVEAICRVELTLGNKRLLYPQYLGTQLSECNIWWLIETPLMPLKICILNITLLKSIGSLCLQQMHMFQFHTASCMYCTSDITEACGQNIIIFG